MLCFQCVWLLVFINPLSYLSNNLSYNCSLNGIEPPVMSVSAPLLFLTSDIWVNMRSVTKVYIDIKHQILTPHYIISWLHFLSVQPRLSLWSDSSQLLSCPACQQSDTVLFSLYLMALSPDSVLKHWWNCPTTSGEWTLYSYLNMPEQQILVSQLLSKADKYSMWYCTSSAHSLYCKHPPMPEAYRICTVHACVDRTNQAICWHSLRV